AESRSRTASARLAQAEAAREAAESAFEVRAPFAGVLVRRHVDAGADVAPGTPLVDLRSYGGVEVVTDVPEAAAGSLANARAWVQSGNEPWRALRLVSADGMVDPATRTRGARYVLREGAAPEPGSYARVRIEVAGAARSAEFAVPATAVVRRGALAGVYIVQDGRAYLRWLRLGALESGAYAVLSGLASGDAVIASPTGLRDGAPITTGNATSAERK
ncbi:MAG: efflux RND transporter periplasmic adaptor subunit, partial [Candidatus Eisenbacteria bacterium]|nr:efflux RND transporter periplasmic adaptor subunit [Candidatus Eisenbacteria bacterium]